MRPPAALPARSRRPGAPRRAVRHANIDQGGCLHPSLPRPATRATSGRRRDGVRWCGRELRHRRCRRAGERAVALRVPPALIIRRAKGARGVGAAAARRLPRVRTRVCVRVASLRAHAPRRGACGARLADRPRVGCHPRGFPPAKLRDGVSLRLPVVYERFGRGRAQRSRTRRRVRAAHGRETRPNRMPSSTTDASSPFTYRRLRELSRWCQGHLSIRRRACHARAGLPVLCPGAPSDSKAINPVFVVRPAACSVWAAASLVTHAQGSKLYSVSVAGHSRRRRAQPATSGDGKVGGSLRRCSNRKPAAGMRRH